MLSKFKFLLLIFFIFSAFQSKAILTTPTLVAPTNSSSFNVPNVLLDWSGSVGATAYEFRIDTNALLTGSPVQTAAVSQFTTTNLRFGTIYYWQVRAIKTTAPIDSSNWSTIWTFTTVDFLNLISPTNSSSFIVPNELLDWSGITGVTNYQVELDTVNTFNSSVLVSNNTSTVSQFATSNLYFGTTYYWRVRAMHSVDTTQWSSVWSFTTTNSLNLVSPSNGSNFIVPSELLDWSGIFGVTNYQLELDTVNTFNSSVLVSNNTSTVSQFSTTNLYFGTTYYWRVRAMHSLDTTQWSNVWSFTTTNSLNLVSPSNGSNFIVPNELLDWSALFGVTNYQIELDTVNTFNSSLLVSNNTSTVSQFSTSNLYFGTTYYWRVRAMHSVDTMQWSNVWSFTTTNNVNLSSPTNGANFIVPNVLLDWSGLLGITNYQVELDTVNTFNSSVLESINTSTVSQFSTSNLYFGTTYYWRVRAMHSVDTTQWSNVWSFTTTNILNLVSPTNGANFIVPNELLDWTGLSGVTNYQVELDTVNTFNSSVLVSSNTSTVSQFSTSNLYFGITYYWRVRAMHSVDTTQWSNVRLFTTLDDLNLVSPTNGSNFIVPNQVLDWSGIFGVTNYQVELDTVNTFNSSVLVSSNTSVNSQFTTSNLYFGTIYYWRVRGMHAVDTTQWSNVWSFTTFENIALVSPANGSISVPLNPLLDWLAVLGINGYEYRYSDSPTFSSSTILTTATSSATLVSLSYGTEYFWQVRAFHATDTTNWSTAWSFTTLYQITAAPLLINPSNLAVNVLVVGTSLDWNSVGGAVNYEYQIADNVNFTNATTGTTSLLSTSLSALLNNTVYYWRVRAINGSGNSPWSTVWSFTTTTNVGMSEIQNQGGYSLYPNPASSQISILNSNKNVQRLTYLVLDVTGRIVVTGSLSEMNTTINISSYQEGVYYILLDNNIRLKFVKSE